jgi:hypothetical protein
MACSHYNFSPKIYRKQIQYTVSAALAQQNEISYTHKSLTAAA